VLEVSRLGTYYHHFQLSNKIAPPYKQFVDFVLFVVLCVYVCVCVCVFCGGKGGQRDVGAKSM
jgi:hypothetical protein